MTWALFILAGIACFALFMAWLTGSVDVHFIREFERRFPDRCVVCSYHQHGHDHRLLLPGTPMPEHDCTERRT